MSWTRPPDLPTNRTNTTPQQDTHPTDHNQISSNVNLTARKAEDLDYYLSALGSDGIGNVGRVLIGTTPGGSIVQGGAAEIAYINLTAGCWVVHYTVLVSSPTAFTAKLDMIGANGGNRSHTIGVEAHGSNGAVLSFAVATLARAGRVSVNLGAPYAADPVATYADPTIHQIFAVGTVAF